MYANIDTRVCRPALANPGHEQNDAQYAVTRAVSELLASYGFLRFTRLDIHTWEGWWHIFVDGVEGSVRTREPNGEEKDTVYLPKLEIHLPGFINLKFLAEALSPGLLSTESTLRTVLAATTNAASQLQSA